MCTRPPVGRRGVAVANGARLTGMQKFGKEVGIRRSVGEAHADGLRKEERNEMVTQLRWRASLRERSICTKQEC